MADIVPHARDRERKDVMWPQQLPNAALLDGSVPPPLSQRPRRVEILFAEEVQGRHEPHTGQERVAGLGDVGRVLEVVVSVPFVVGGSEREEQGAEAV